MSGWNEAPTEYSRLVIVLVREEDWEAVDGPTAIDFAWPLPAEPRVLPAVEPEFGTCYHAEMPALVRFLIQCGANRHDAADAAQEAFIELFRQWPTVRKPRQWLRTVAFRIFLRQPVDPTSPPQTTRDRPGTLSASDSFDLRQEEQHVLDMLNLLPTAQRAVLALHYDQFETRDIAEILGMQQAAVRKNLERARAALKKLLDADADPWRRREPPAQGAGE